MTHSHVAAYDRFVTELAAQDKFSGTILLAHRGRPVLVRSHGMADKARAIPNTPETVFGLASVTKCFTAVSVMQLVRQERIAPHATLGTYLDGFPADIANTVTVHQLLTHTSGIGRPPVGNTMPWSPDWDSFDEFLAETLAIVRRTPAQFTPGTKYAYSNDGYHVLGAIVGRVAGMSYYDYVRRHVFAPAGMAHSDFVSRTRLRTDPRVAHPYRTQPDGSRVDFTADPILPYTNGPAGGAYATASDLLAFACALSDDRLLAPALTALATSGKAALAPADAKEPPSQFVSYGYGFSDVIVNNSRVYGHSGGGPGIATRLDVHPGTRWVSIVLGNYDTSILPIVERSRALITG